MAATTAATPTGFVGWILQYGQIIAFFVQVAYWLVIAAVAVWAAWLFKRLVDFRTSGAQPAADAMPASAAPSSPAAKPAKEKKAPVKVEDFTD
jgi:hypothetical protein